jgi:hypothetical protein
MHRVSPASEKADVHEMLLPVMAAFNHSRITHWTHAHWMDAVSCLSTESAPHGRACPQKRDALCPEERSACTDGRTRARKAGMEPARQPAAVPVTVTTPMRYWSPVLDATTVLIPSSRDVGAKHFASTPSELT